MSLLLSLCLLGVWVADIAATANFPSGSSVCVGYANCTKVTFSLATAQAYCGSDCAVTACITADSTNCWKNLAQDSISHTCYSSNATSTCCSSLTSYPSPATINLDALGDNWKIGSQMCVVGRPGEYVYFAMKDATLLCDAGAQGKPVTFLGASGTVDGTCYPFSSSYSASCSGQAGTNIACTCMYAVKLPNICPSGGSCTNPIVHTIPNLNSPISLNMNDVCLPVVSNGLSAFPFESSQLWVQLNLPPILDGTLLWVGAKACGAQCTACASPPCGTSCGCETMVSIYRDCTTWEFSRPECGGILTDNSSVMLGLAVVPLSGTVSHCCFSVTITATKWDGQCKLPTACCATD